MKFHSSVDIITNSSTEIYVFPSEDAIDRTKVFLQKLLTSINPEYKVDDYFDVYYELSLNYVKNEYAYGSTDQFEQIFNNYIQNVNLTENQFNVLSVKDQQIHFQEIAKIITQKYNDNEYQLERENEYGEPNYSNLQALSLMVKPKNSEAFNLFNAIPFCVAESSNY